MKFINLLKDKTKCIPHVLFFGLCVKFFFVPATLAEVLALGLMGAFVFLTESRVANAEFKEFKDNIVKELAEMHNGLVEQKKYLEENRNAIASVKLQSGVKTQQAMRF